MKKVGDMGIAVNYILFSLSLILAIFFFCPSVSAQSEEEMQILQMFFKEEDLVVSPTRTPKPISQVAENISIVTAKDIENMNAHTLTDVLNTIPGVQMDIRGGPGSETSPHIQGSEFRHVLVIIDGVTLNNLSDSAADISAISVQNIGRIEIIKGPASSSWGSSLGGVINIITKPVETERNVSGIISASYGERDTGDYRAEASGKVNKIGYYIYAGNLVSDGLTPNTDFYENNLYTKLKYDINEKADITFTLGYNKGSRGRGQYEDWSFSSRFEYLFSTLSMNYSITDAAGLNISFRTSKQNSDVFTNQLSTGDELMTSVYNERGNGGSAKLAWKSDIHNIVFGADYDNGKLKSDSIKDEQQRLEKWAFFANDTILLFDKLSVTPGIRYDHTSTNGDFVSPILGITYKLGAKTILRAYAARGFSIPPLASTFGTGNPNSVPNPDLEMEKVWSYQAGMETTALKYVWVKATLFRHDIQDAIDTEVFPDDTFAYVNKDKQRRQGVEIEVKTVPVYNTSLFTGFAFVDAENLESEEKLENVPNYTYDIGIQYNDKKSFSASLKGHYIWWIASPDFRGKYSDFVWDINLLKKIHKSDNRSIDLFFTAHNIFNGSQYLIESFKNPRRWIEAGVRLKF